MTPEIRSLIKERDLSHKIARQTSQTRDWLIFKAYKIKVKNELRNAEKLYVHEQILLNQNAPRCIRKIIRSCIPRKINDQPCYTKPTSELCEQFNNYFISVGEKTAESAKRLAIEYDLIMELSASAEPKQRYPLSDQFFFNQVSYTKIEQVIKNMPSNKAPGYNKISINVLKDCYPHILSTLTGLVNASFSQEVFPLQWKKAEVIPLHKEGDHQIAANNRPISLLPVPLKVTERVALEQFTDYLIETNKLNKHQNVTLFLTECIYQSIDRKNLTAVILLDLSKAFDSISHDILLEKLRKFGTSASATVWFRSYLGERVQSVRVGQHLSDMQRVTHGVPQGSILGPLLLNLHVNEISSMCKDCKIESFVDDSKLFLSFSISDIAESMNKLDADLKRVAAWCCSNSLLINPRENQISFVWNQASSDQD
ncbi:Hypothetical predicted protein [Paramuricea clavata]|uniref:Uncharacterized protein n=1 Tax=Paramuricea clavata TaxID=317549 RepID=A0A6S7H3Z0_PARCT|nr:Hypothetical predicted protein [Paramuricea clavata]